MLKKGVVVRSRRVRKQALRIGNLLQAVCYSNTDTRSQESKESNTHAHTYGYINTHSCTHTELQWPCWDISGDIETQTKPSQRRAENVAGKTRSEKDGRMK